MIVNVATGRYVIGQQRLFSRLSEMGGGAEILLWTDELPAGCPPHSEVPYAFKAYALREALLLGAEVVLWCDACIILHRSLSPLWQRIEDAGYWFSDNGWWNGQWASDRALQLFGYTRDQAMQQTHVVATAFGLDLTTRAGGEFLRRYLEQASSVGAFPGSWTNAHGEVSGDARCLGHRHDQTVASFLVHEFGWALTRPPDWFSYLGGETEATCLVADGKY